MTDLWEAYIAETPAKDRSPQGAMAFAVDRLSVAPAQAEQSDWKSRFLDAIKALHNSLDVIEAIDSEILLTGQIKDLVDEALAPRQSSTVSSTDREASK